MKLKDSDSGGGIRIEVTAEIEGAAQDEATRDLAQRLLHQSAWMMRVHMMNMLKTWTVMENEE